MRPTLLLASLAAGRFGHWRIELVRRERIGLVLLGGGRGAGLRIKNRSSLWGQGRIVGAGPNCGAGPIGCKVLMAPSA
jgi:hypothetical protein